MYDSNLLATFRNDALRMLRLTLIAVMAVTACFSILAESKSVATDQNVILVNVAQGQLRGVSLKSRAGRDYFGFLGVPYAEPPVGDRRFQVPVEAAPWDGTYNATE